jgi:hypothetical protein
MRFVCFVCSVFFAGIAPLCSQDWYSSNASGMALERQPVKAAAFRSEYALSMEKKLEKDIPEILIPYYKTTFTIELRILYQRGKPLRNQWIFRDPALPEQSQGITRLNASLLPDGKKQPYAEDPLSSMLPFIEVYSEESLLTEFHQITAASQRYVTLFGYKERLLLSAETRYRGRVVWTDEYKYTRNFKLRGVERRFTNVKQVPLSFRFPPPGPFIDPDSPYDSVFMGGALKDVYALQAPRVNFDTDELGRVLGERHYDQKGKEIAVVTNDWFNDRIVSVSWKAGEAWGSTEFEYSESGDRISEKNFRDGLLERSVTRVGTQDIEELYIAEKPVLRAVWEDGRKISEERLQ